MTFSFQFSLPFAAIHHHSHGTYMTPRILAASNQWQRCFCVAHNQSTIDAQRGDHFLQAEVETQLTGILVLLRGE